MNDQQQTGRAPGLNVGSASIVMVFAVLCLTVFAVLSLLTARSELALAERAAGAVANFYAADTLAVELLDNLTAGTDPAADPSYTSLDDGLVSYTVPIDDNQSLFVLLALDSGPRILEWRVYMSGEWMPENGLNLFMGF